MLGTILTKLGIGGFSAQMYLFRDRDRPALIQLRDLILLMNLINHLDSEQSQADISKMKRQHGKQYDRAPSSPAVTKISRVTTSCLYRFTSIFLELKSLEKNAKISRTKTSCLFIMNKMGYVAVLQSVQQ